MRRNQPSPFLRRGGTALRWVRVQSRLFRGTHRNDGLFNIMRSSIVPGPCALSPVPYTLTRWVSTNVCRASRVVMRGV